MQAICREAERRGHTVRAVDKNGFRGRAGVGIAVGKHAYAVEVSELLDRVPLTEAEREEWRAEHNRYRFSWEKERTPPQTRGIPNGKLRVSRPERWHGARYTWAEGPRGGFETKLLGFFAEVERRAEEDERRAQARARHQEENRRREEERYERELRARITAARVARPSDEIGLWRLAQETREYVALVRLSLHELDEADRERVSEWCDWAEEWSRRNDPTRNPSRIRGLDDERDRYTDLQHRNSAARL